MTATLSAIDAFGIEQRLERLRDRAESLESRGRRSSVGRVWSSALRCRASASWSRVPSSRWRSRGERWAPGALETMPVAALLFGIGLARQVRACCPTRSAPADDVGSTVRVTAPPVAVKGPTVPGGEGRSKVRPVGGTGLGMGALMSMRPDETVAGVGAGGVDPDHRASPMMAELPSAAAAETIDDGKVELGLEVRWPRTAVPATGCSGSMPSWSRC